MFGSLKNVLDTKWLSTGKNLYISFSTLNETHIYKIFSCIICNAENVSEYTQINFENQEQYQKYINNLKKQSMHKFNTDITNSQKMITLYTCYSLNNQRLLVYATQIE